MSVQSTPARLRPGLLGRFGIAGAASGAAVVVVLGILLLANGNLETAGRASLRSAQTLEHAATAERRTTDAETSTRAYLLTGRAMYRRDARMSLAAAQRSLAALSRSVAIDPVERTRVATIQSATATLGRTWVTPNLARPVTRAQPFATFSSGERQRVAIERQYAKLVAREQALQVHGLARVRQLHSRASYVALAAILAIPALLLAFLGYVALGLLRPVRGLAELAARIEAGDEGAVAEVKGPREIAQLQDAFNRMSSRVGQRRREIIEHAPITIWEVEGRELSWISPYWRSMAGDGAEAPATIDDIDALTHPEDRPLVQKVRSEGVASMQPFDYRYRIVRRDGQIRWLWTRARTMGLVNGAPRIIGFTLDVTDDERTRHELAHAQRLESIGHLAGGVAHDFNNLLTVISGYGTLAQMRLDDPARLEEPLAEIVAAAARASALTRQLLMFSREQPFELQLLDLNGVVRTLLPMLERLIEERITLLCGLADDLPPIRFDRGQLEQVIVNLAVNARDAITGAGQIVLSTSAGPDGTARLSVSDDGMGIDAATLEHIFDPFFTTKPPGSGTGLGLSTVHGIVARGGGHIEVDSQPGVGTTFVICFPATEDLAAAA
ncbi:MAG TPA: ATP-binding protein [Gaiellaceae bacterium]|nr:ATP-binding protein [Gaiellaceae bacterium]